MRKITLSLVLGLGVILGTSAQNFGFGEANLESVIVQTYDGSIYKGYVLGRTDFEITILLPTMDTISVHEVLIKRKKSSNDYDIFKKGRAYPKKGFYGTLFFSSNYNSEGRGSNGLNAQLVYQPSQKFGYGVSGGFQSNGLNVSGVDWDWSNYTFWQFDAYGKYNLSRNSTRIYADMKLGYGFAGDTWREEEVSGGMHIEPGIGFQFASKGHIRFNVGLSQQFQYSEGASSVWSPNAFEQTQVNYELWYSRTVLRIGLEFF